MSVREALLATVLILGLGLVVLGVAMLSKPIAVILAGASVVLLGIVFLAEVS